MSYIPKIIKCRLHTGGERMDELQEHYSGQKLTHSELESFKNAMDLFDGLILYLSLWDYDGGIDYHLYSWGDEADEKVMLAMYELEQMHPFPEYKNRKQAFIHDWKCGRYDSSGSVVFPPQVVEVLEVVSEERRWR